MAESAETNGDRGENGEYRRVPLDEIEPARSRHMWTRSAVHTTADLLIAGRWNGAVTAFEADSLEPRWAVDHPDHAVGIATLDGDDRAADADVVAGRGETG